jgi:ATP-dependent DNA helicase RecQ
VGFATAGGAANNGVVSDAIQLCLEERFSLRAFRPSQRDVIDAVVAGRDVLCVMPTGAGKSLCYQLPAVQGGGVCVVVSPLISLMEDQVTQLRRKGIEACFINSSLSPQARRETMNALANGYSGLLYLAPERLATGELDSTLNQLGVSLLAIDEAHCISQWGHDFRPEYSQIGIFRERLGNPPTIALTATATEDVRTDIIRLLHLREPEIVVTGFDRTNLLYEVRRPESAKDRDKQLVKLLHDQAGTGIVYCSTRKNVEEVAAWLGEEFKKRVVVPYHAGMDMSDRTWAQDQFMKTPGSIVVATSAFGMGINKPDVRFVVHYNMPGTIEQYYQEAGRAGRDGALSRCVLMYRSQDRSTQQYFIDQIGKDNFETDFRVIRELKEHAQQKLDLMVRYSTGHQCRRQMILNYFGDDAEVENCECDVCRRGTAIDLDAPIPETTVLLVRQLLSGVARVNGKFGAKAAAELLAGVENERATRGGFTSMPTFGLLKVRSLKEISRMLDRVLEAGLARQVDPEGKFRPVVELTPAGIAVMRGDARPPGLLGDLEGTRVEGERVRSRQSGGDEVELDADGQERFEKLRAVRSRLAKEKEVPAYVVCHDRTLRAIAQRIPKSLEELETVKGMGSMKVALYGPAILEALA